MEILRSLGTPLPDSSAEVFVDVGARSGAVDCLTCRGKELGGSIVFSPLAQGLLSDRYLQGFRRIRGRRAIFS